VIGNSLLSADRIGVLFGTLGAVVISSIAHWNTLISPHAILLAFVFSAAGACSSVSGRHAGRRAWTRSSR